MLDPGPVIVQPSGGEAGYEIITQVPKAVAETCFWKHSLRVGAEACFHLILRIPLVA